MAELRTEKYVSSLPVTLVANTIYYVKNGSGFEVYVTNSSGTIIAYPANYVHSNVAITGATKTKITYDSQGLILSGSDATTADITDSTNKRYVTDANLTKIGLIDQAVSSTEKISWNAKQEDLWIWQKSKGYMFFDDFLGSLTDITTSTGVTTNRVGTGASLQQVSTVGNRTTQNGIAGMSTGTTATGSASILLGLNTGTTYIGDGAITYEVYVNLSTLSTSSERYHAMFGFYSSSNYLNTTNEMTIIYDEGGAHLFGGGGGASPNWKCITRNGATTFTTTSIAVSATSWYKLRIELNSTATSVEYFIDDVSVAVHTTGIPATSVTSLYMVNGIFKSVGTSARSLYMDYMGLKKTFTTTR